MITDEREATESFEKITNKIYSRNIDHNEGSGDLTTDRDEEIGNGKKMAEDIPYNQLNKEIRLLELMLEKGMYLKCWGNSWSQSHVNCRVDCGK